jgi:hypothetical protein
LFLSIVVTGVEHIPAGTTRAQVEFAVVEHASDSHKKHLASKNVVYNHAARVLRKQQEQVHYEE